MSEPSVEAVRQRIGSVGKEDIRHCLMAAYLLGGRISELISKAAPRDTTTARGGQIQVAIRRYKRRKAATFKILTAKRKKGELEKARIIALPLHESYEPWSQSLFEYMQEREGAVFPFTRQRMWRASKKVFAGFTYPIEGYKLKKNGDAELVNVQAHYRNFRLHALRHIRASELVEIYGFNGIDLAVFMGWTLKKIGAPSVISRYLSLSWQTYFPKLLKKRDV